MPFPFIPAAIAAANIAAPFIGRALAGRRPRTPEAPDLVSPILAELANRRSENERDLQFRNIRDIEATRASGVNSVVAADFRNQSVGQANDLRRRLDSIITDRIQSAERQQALLNFNADQARFADDLNAYNNRAQAISNIISGVANFSTGLLGNESTDANAAGAGDLSVPVGVNPYQRSYPDLFNFQGTGLTDSLNSNLYIRSGGQFGSFNSPTLNYNPNVFQRGVQPSGLFQFQDRSNFSGSFPRIY